MLVILNSFFLLMRQLREPSRKILERKFFNIEFPFQVYAPVVFFFT